jgi:hypothetical protein
MGNAFACLDAACVSVDGTQYPKQLELAVQR